MSRWQVQDAKTHLSEVIHKALPAMTLGELRKGVGIKRRSDPLAATGMQNWVDGLERRFLPQAAQQS